MTREYQYNFSDMHKVLYEREPRRRKAATMVAVLTDFLGDVRNLSVLDTGSSTGIIDDYLADHFGAVTGVDIDEQAVQFAGENFPRPNLTFTKADAMAMPFPDGSFDVVICSQVYEHVPDAQKLMAEIFRVLKTGGVCYFAAGNRFILIERHYNLPLLSAIPRPLSHLYVRMTGKAKYYYEKHLSVWGLRRLVRQFHVHDYTLRLLDEPDRFAVEYLVGGKGSIKGRLAPVISRLAYWLCPTYIWVLQKK